MTLGKGAVTAAQPPGASGAVVEVEGVSRRFGVVHALDDVTIQVGAGEFVGLAGENGAGKSTLLSVISGLVQPDHGVVRINGVEVGRDWDFHKANLAGVFRVYQEQALLPNLRVYENLYLGHESLFSRGGVLNRRRMKQMVREHIREFVGRAVDPNALVSQLSWGERQLVEIVRAFALASLLEVESPVVLLDEPTAAMTHDDLEAFYALLRVMRGHTLFDNASFILVSHRLEEVLDLSDRVYVMKDGAVVGEYAEPRNVDVRELHALMVGRMREETYYCEDRQRDSFGDVVLEMENASVDGEFEDVSFSLRAGEILGIGGLTGSGKSELGRAIAGLVKLDGGRIMLDGRDVTSTSIGGRVDASVGYVPLDRHGEGLILYLPITINMTLSALRDVATKIRGLLAPAKERDATRAAMERFGIVAPSEKTKPVDLSGGNQQKVVIARSLVANSKLIVLDHPTRGVDAGAKYEIHVLLRELAERGVAILMITDELPELIGMSNRIIVMRGGQVTQETPAPAGRKPTEESVVASLV
jgi:ABC-type sugar transport system ATPase subunit